MKTLVIQLARLGDILQTLPALNAYCRIHKNEQVHLLVRKKFSEIAHIIPVCSKIIEMDTVNILKESVLSGQVGVPATVDAFQQWVQDLKKQGYTKIINLSFSPFSSYLTQLLHGEGIEVLGYTRHTDGFLAIPDDSSAYFYAQVGVNKSNRFHLIDLFASVLGVEIAEQDWNVKLPSKRFFAPGKYMAFHIGASNAKKALPIPILAKLLAGLAKTTNREVYLLGAKDDMAVAEVVTQQVANSKIKNLVGKTSLTELIDIIAGAEIFLGADSGPMQICNLTDTKCINFSNDFVNFWETGPRTSKSFVCYAKDFILLDVHQVIAQVANALEDKPTTWIQGDRLGFYGPYPSSPESDFQWQMIKAIYLGENFPEIDSSRFAKAIVHLNEVNDISLHHLENFQLGNKQQSNVLETADQIMDSLAAEVEEIMPLVFWFRTEKIRLGPMPLTDLIVKYVDLHKKLKQVLNLYLKPKWEISEDLL
jgi:heptosyltransferase III